MQVNIDGLDEIFLQTASEEQLEFVSPVKKFEYDTIDVLCAIIAPTNTSALAGVSAVRSRRGRIRPSRIVTKVAF